MFSLIGAYFQTIHPLSHPPQTNWHLVNVALSGPPLSHRRRHQTLLSQCWCVFMPFGVLNMYCRIYRSLYRNPCRSPELKCVFWWTGQWQSPALRFRVPPAVAVREAKSANSREPDTECATVCQFLQHWGELALNTSQDTYMLPHSGHILQQQRHSSHLTRMWPPTSMECICMICMSNFCILILCRPRVLL